MSWFRAENVFAAVPVKDLWGTKSRLSPVLDPGARAGLTLYMMRRVIRVLLETGVGHVCVVSPDVTVLETARESGACTLYQQSYGLNPALDEARDRALDKGCPALLALPADLPLLSVPDIGALLADLEESRVVISPDHAASGTNALFLRPPDALPFLFGPGSYEAHRQAAADAGLKPKTCRRPSLAFDLDTSEHLERLRRHDPGYTPTHTPGHTPEETPWPG